MRTKVMKTKNILRTLLIAVTMLLGANNAQADTRVWNETPVKGGTCYDNFGGSEGSFTISNTAFANAKAGNKLRVVASLNTDDGSDGRWMFYIASNLWYSNLKFSDWHGNEYEKEKQYSKDNPNNYNASKGYFEFTLTEESLEPLAGSTQGGIRIHFLGLTVSEVWLITNTGSDTGSSTAETTSNFWKASSTTATTANNVLMDNSILTATSVYATTLKSSNQTIGDESFTHYIQVRGNKAPDASNVNGTENSGSTTIKISVKKNATITLYYRRQIDNNNSGQYTSDNGKDLLLVNQSAPGTLVAGDAETVSSSDGSYGYVTKTYTLAAGQTYTLYATGTTVQFYGISCQEKAIDTPTPTETKHTVYFYTDEAKTDLWHSEEVAEGAEIPMPPSNPSKDGFIFGGWKDLPTYMPTYDVYTSAIWVEEVKNFNANASYDSNYGSVTLSSSYPEKGSTVDVTITPAAGFYVSNISLSTGGQISGGNNSYSFTMPGQDVTVYVEFAAGAVTASITSSSKLATFSSDYDLDFSSVTGLKAYIVTGEDDGYAVLSKVTGTVAAGTGLIIYGETTDIPVTINGSTPQGNKLVGVLSNTSVSGAGKYVLTEKNGVALFGETSAAEATVPAGHAYLNLGASARTRQVIIKVGDDTTGISDIQAENGEQVIYNLRGQRVEKPTRGGIYIVNGKKVIIK